MRAVSTRRIRILIGGVVVVLAAAPALAVSIPRHEELSFQWRLKGVMGAIAGIFFPRRGEAVLTSFEGHEPTGAETSLELTSKRAPDAFYRYGAGPTSEGGRRVWSSYRFRGKEADKDAVVENPEMFDFASAIRALRLRPPEQGEMRFVLWSDGRRYPLVASPGGSEKVERRGVVWQATRWDVRGLELEGERFWKGRFRVWFADDDYATPVRIVGERSVLSVQLDLVAAVREGEPAFVAPYWDDDEDVDEEEASR